MAGFNAHQVGGVVQGSDVEAVTDDFLNLIGNNYGRSKVFTAVHNTMADGSDFIHALDAAVLRIYQNFQNQFHSSRVIGQVFLNDNLVLALGFMIQGASRDSYAVNQTYGHN